MQQPLSTDIERIAATAPTSKRRLDYTWRRSAIVVVPSSLPMLGPRICECPSWVGRLRNIVYPFWRSTKVWKGTPKILRPAQKKPTSTTVWILHSLQTHSKNSTINSKRNISIKLADGGTCKTENLDICSSMQETRPSMCRSYREILGKQVW